MSPTIRIGIAGDYRADNPTHTATDAAFAHAAAHLSLTVDARWLPTNVLSGPAGEGMLAECDGLMIAPGSPYLSMDGALRAIKYARENEVPLIGTCGGFQHIVIEFARNVLGVQDADHAEEHPDAPRLFITPLSCSLFGQTMDVRLLPGTRARAIYGMDSAHESYYCNFGLNPDHQVDLVNAGLAITAVDADNEPRIVELPTHPFFIGTLFVPQSRSRQDAPHPLILALVEAAMVRGRKPDGPAAVAGGTRMRKPA